MANFFDEIDSFFGGKSTMPNPADAAMPYLNQVPGTIKPYYDPYISAGQGALGTLQGQYSQLVNDPGSLMRMLGSGFQQSPGYQFQYNQGKNAVDNAAASGGFLGTEQHQQNAGAMASNLANKDFYDYFNNAKDLYGRGLSGYEGINQMGYNASDTLASSLGANLMNQGQLAYQGQQSENEAQQAGMQNLLSLLGGLGGGIANKFFGGGGKNANSGY